MLILSRKEAFAKGFRIDNTVYRNVGYKGNRLNPTEVCKVPTVNEEKLAMSMSILIDKCSHVCVHEFLGLILATANTDCGYTTKANVTDRDKMCTICWHKVILELTHGKA